jgi:agmatine deiminase
MPAEWEMHQATWLVWPTNRETFPGDLMEEVERTYVKMIEELAVGERVELLVEDEKAKDRVVSMIRRNNNVIFHQVKTVDVWARDYGPIFVKNSEGVAATKWSFNAWGNKYEDFKADDETGMKIAQSTGMRIFTPNMVLEGGSIEVNGLGTCITTRQCLLNQNRNPQLSEREISQNLKDYLGITKLIWLDSGIDGDDTDGHVDDIARFLNAKTVLCMTEDNKTDKNWNVLKENLEILTAATDQEGSRINVIPIRMPKRIDGSDGRLPASYANFYIANAVVLVPTYGSSNDAAALATLQSFFPGRKIVGINCRSLVYGLGAIHCVTQQQPYPNTRLLGC